MPANLVGAYVSVFVGASGHEAAALKAVTEVRSRHLAITRLTKKLNMLVLARMVGHKDLR